MINFVCRKFATFIAFLLCILTDVSRQCQVLAPSVEPHGIYLSQLIKVGMDSIIKVKFCAEDAQPLYWPNSLEVRGQGH